MVEAHAGFADLPDGFFAFPQGFGQIGDKIIVDDQVATGEWLDALVEALVVGGVIAVMAYHIVPLFGGNEVAFAHAIHDGVVDN